MSKTAISYADEAWQVTGGCMKCSPGCDHCWSERLVSTRFKTNPRYDGLTKDGKWTGEIKLFEDRLEEPLHWKKPRVIFVDSQSDLFHPKVPFEFIDKVWDVMFDCMNIKNNPVVLYAKKHVFLILTKRPKKLLEFADWKNKKGERIDYPNVHFGLTICTQKEWDDKGPDFLQIPGKKWLSIEPCLGEINFKYIWDDEDYYCPACGYMGEECESDEDGELICPECGGYENTVGFDKVSVQPIDDLPFPDIDQVILGGESGPEARLMHSDWARSVRDQCAEAGVAFYMKQMSGREQIPKDLMVRDLIWRIDK